MAFLREAGEHARDQPPCADLEGRRREVLRADAREVDDYSHAVCRQGGEREGSGCARHRWPGPLTPRKPEGCTDAAHRLLLLFVVVADPLQERLKTGGRQEAGEVHCAFKEEEVGGEWERVRNKASSAHLSLYVRPGREILADRRR